MPIINPSFKRTFYPRPRKPRVLPVDEWGFLGRDSAPRAKSPGFDRSKRVPRALPVGLHFFDYLSYHKIARPSGIGG